MVPSPQESFASSTPQLEAKGIINNDISDKRIQAPKVHTLYQERLELSRLWVVGGLSGLSMKP
jgi:hypothetical protein